MNETKVLSVTPGEKEGSWLKIRVLGKNKEGQEVEKDNYIKDASLFPLIKQSGFYEFTKEKKGQYWEIVGAKFIRPLDSTTNQVFSVPSKTVDANVSKQNDSICAQVATKAAAEIVCEALRQGAFKKEGQLNFESVTDNAALLARTFMTEIGKFVNETKEANIPTLNGKSYLDDAGRLHEKVEGV